MVVVAQVVQEYQHVLREPVVPVGVVITEEVVVQIGVETVVVVEPRHLED